MQDLKHIEAFITVVQSGSFVAAASKLGVSKAMISRRVADLETALNVRLLNRSTRKSSLTDSGQAYFERCVDILNQLSEADAAVSANATQVTGKLRINAPLSFGNLHLAPVWGAFMLQHPNVALDVELSDRLVDTVEEGFDLTIRIGDLQPSSLVSRPLASARMVLCAAPKYLARAQALFSPQDIAGHRVTVYTGGSKSSLWTFSLGGKTHDVPVASLQGVRSNSGDTCVAAAIAGYGLTYQPMFLVEAPLKAGLLVEQLSAYTSPTLGIYALYPSRKHLSGKVRAMIDFLSLQFASRRWE